MLTTSGSRGRSVHPQRLLPLLRLCRSHHQRNPQAIQRTRPQRQASCRLSERGYRQPHRYPLFPRRCCPTSHHGRSNVTSSQRLACGDEHPTCTRSSTATAAGYACTDTTPCSWYEWLLRQHTIRKPRQLRHGYEWLAESVRTWTAWGGAGRRRRLLKRHGRDLIRVSLAVLRDSFWSGISGGNLDCDICVLGARTMPGVVQVE